MFQSLARFASILPLLPVPPSPHLSLSLACGHFGERNVLAQHLPAWTHLGIDRIASPNVIQSDVRHLPFPRQAVFRMIILRHPPVLEDNTLWNRVCQHAVSYLQKGGVFLVSTYMWDEADLLRRGFRLPSMDISESATAAPDFAGHDRYLMVFIA